MLPPFNFEEFVQKLVKRYSRSNISLKMGRFVTASDIQRRKKAIAKIKFSLSPAERLNIFLRKKR